jgi:hypothetical protein
MCKRWKPISNTAVCPGLHVALLSSWCEELRQHDSSHHGWNPAGQAVKRHGVVLPQFGSIASLSITVYVSTFCLSFLRPESCREPPVEYLKKWNGRFSARKESTLYQQTTIQKPFRGSVTQARVVLLNYQLIYNRHWHIRFCT